MNPSSLPMEPIAVVGIGLRFSPNVTTTDEFWQLLLKKQCTSSEWPRQRLNIGAFHDAARREHSSVATSFEQLTGWVPDICRSPLVERISLMKILAYLMLRSFQFRPPRQLQWIRSSACFWKQHIRLWKMVTTPLTCFYMISY